MCMLSGARIYASVIKLKMKNKSTQWFYILRYPLSSADILFSFMSFCKSCNRSSLNAWFLCQSLRPIRMPDIPHLYVGYKGNVYMQDVSIGLMPGLWGFEYFCKNPPLQEIRSLWYELNSVRGWGSTSRLSGKCEVTSSWPVFPESKSSTMSNYSKLLLWFDRNT